MLSCGVLERRRLVSLARLSRASHHRLDCAVSDQTPVRVINRRSWKSHAMLELGIASHTMYNVLYSAVEITRQEQPN
jgi:hypothetical protein